VAASPFGTYEQRAALGADAGLATGLRVCQSPLVATPLTVGVVSPTVVLPEAWRECRLTRCRRSWLMNARTIARRDPAIAFAGDGESMRLLFHPWPGGSSARSPQRRSMRATTRR